MGERSVYASVMLTLLVGIAAVALYLVVDSMSLLKQQLVRTERSMERVAGSVEKLTRSLEAGVSVARPRNVGGGEHEASDQGSSEMPANRFCNADLRDPGAEPGGGMVMRTSSSAGNLNYLVKNEAGTGDIWEMCNDSLAGRHAIHTKRWEPILAKDWEISADGLTYVIHLRRGALWHPYTDPKTGTQVPSKEVTAGDFLFWWETVQNPNVPCDPQRSYFELVESFTAPDPYTLKIVWKEPYHMAKSMTLGLSPYPRHYYRPLPEDELDDKEWAEEFIASPRNQWMIGCGPYRIEEWERGRHLTLVRFEAYHGPKPALKTVVLREIKDDEIALNEFRKDKIDRLGLLPVQWERQTRPPEFYLVTEDLDRASEAARAFDLLKAQGQLPPECPADYKYEKYQYLSSFYMYIGYNLRRPLFRDRQVRVALTHLVDRERILREVYKNLGTITTGPFLKQNPYYDHSVKPYPFDPEKAKQMLAEAGWTDTDGDGILDHDLDGDGTREPFEFNFMTISSSANQRKYATMVKEDMKRAGIAVNIKPLDWANYLQRLEEWAFDVCSLGWSGGALESDPNQIWHSRFADKKKSSNHVGYKSEEADALIDRGRRTLDIEKRIEMFRRFHRLLHRDQPYTFLFVRPALVAQSRRYRNVRIYKTGMNTKLMWVPGTLQVR